MKTKIKDKLSGKETSILKEEFEQQRLAKKCQEHCPECGRVCLNSISGHESKHQCGYHSW